MSLITVYKSSLVAQMVKNLPAMQEAQVRSLSQEDPLEKGMATHSSIIVWTIPVHMEEEMATHSCVLAWRIPGTGEPGGLPSMGSHRVRHD